MAFETIPLLAGIRARFVPNGNGLTMHLMDEIYIRIKGVWRYLYRAVDKDGETMDFLRTEHRDKEAA